MNKPSVSKDNITIPQKYLDKIVKMQQDQETARQEEYQLLRQHLDQMNMLLSELITVGASGSTIAASKKYIPFQTGSQEAGQLLIKPQNPDNYPTKIDIYSINDNRVIPHMTLVNDGPGELFFINAYAKNQFNIQEGHLHINDQRELFNVYEIRLRATLPLTTFRLIEGIFRTGSFAPQTKANVEIRPTVQSNEILKTFGAVFDNSVPITVTSPTPVTYNSAFIFPGSQPPLAPGESATLVDHATGFTMPFLIPESFVLETFSVIVNLSTDFTLRDYFELIPGSNIFVIADVFPIGARGSPINFTPNLNSLSTQFIDPLGAPAGGRQILVTITNDDPFNDMIGVFSVESILRRLS